MCVGGGGGGGGGRGGGGGGGGVWREGRLGCRRVVGAGSLPPTPHLTSPWKGGGMNWGRGGGGGVDCRDVGVGIGSGGRVVPACAGMTDLGARVAAGAALGEPQY